MQLIISTNESEPDDSYTGPPRAKCNLIGTDCADFREADTKIFLAVDAQDAATNVSGVEDIISNAKHELEVAKRSFEVIQKI